MKFWSFVYRATGWYSPWASVAEQEHLSRQWDRIETLLLSPSNDMSLEDLVSIEIGMWQAKHRFYRRYRA